VNPWETGPLAARRAAAREIAKMASYRTKIDDLLRGLRLQQNHLHALIDADRPDSLLDHASVALNEAIQDLRVVQESLDV
jgi:hypothetical protein